MTELTREQVLLKLADMCGAAATGRSVIPLRDELLAHDAALRAKLEQVERERDAFAGIFGDYGEPPRSVDQARHLWDGLKQQLAAAEARVKELETAPMVRPNVTPLVLQMDVDVKANGGFLRNLHAGTVVVEWPQVEALTSAVEKEAG